MSLTYLYVIEKQRQGPLNARPFVIRRACDQAIRSLRELEDLARVTLEDDELATRARECHECITERILEGRKNVGLSRDEMADVVEQFDWIVQ